MQKFRELTIPCENEKNASAMVAKLVQVCTGPIFEHTYTNPTSPYPVEFIHVDLEGLPNAKLIIGQNWSDPTEVIVVNIVPDDVDVFHLTKDLYNEMLVHFYEQVVKQVTDKAVITPSDCSLKDLLPESHSLLENWYETSNTGGRLSHPNDIERWYEFILSMIRHGENLWSDDLENWLREDKNEREESITEIVDRYDTDRYAMEYAITH